MGCELSRVLPQNSLFTDNHLARLREQFDHLYLYNAVEKDRFHIVLGVKNYKSFENYLDKFFRKHMEVSEDFVGFVRSLEILIFGQTTVGKPNQSQKNYLGPIERLAEVLKLKPETKICKILTTLLFAFVKIDASLVDKIRPQTEDLLEIQKYYIEQFPVIGNAFPEYLKQRLLGGKKYVMPHIPALNSLLSSALPYVYLSSSVFTSLLVFHKLYLSKDTGLDFMKLEDGMAGYLESMLLIIKLHDETLLGGFIERRFKKRNSTYENNSFLFTFAQGYKVYKQTEKSNIVFLNLKNNPIGLGFGGGTPNTARIWLSDNINLNSQVSDTEGGYAPGPLLKGNLQTSLNIIEIELWGCGDESAALKQIEYKDRRQKMIQENEKISSREGRSFLNEYPL